jgi:hypothetical protein
MTTPHEIRQQIRQSLGLLPKPEPVPTVPQEGHAAEFPYWSFSKKRSSVTQLHIDYEDGSFRTSSSRRTIFSGRMSETLGLNFPTLYNTKRYYLSAPFHN